MPKSGKMMPKRSFYGGDGRPEGLYKFILRLVHIESQYVTYFQKKLCK